MKYSWALFIYMFNKCKQAYSMLWFVLFVKKLRIYRSGTSNVIRFRMKNIHSSLIFFLWSFFADTDDSEYSREGRESSFFLSIISTCLRMFRHLFVVLHLRRLPSVIRPNSSNYQAFL